LDVSLWTPSSLLMAFAGKMIPDLQAMAVLPGKGQMKTPPNKQESALGLGHTLQSHGQQVSRGSGLHPEGCVPCSFYCFSLRGCTKGIDCKFCHMKHQSRNTRRGSKKNTKEKNNSKVQAATTCVQAYHRPGPQTMPSHELAPGMWIGKQSRQCITSLEVQTDPSTDSEMKDPLDQVMGPGKPKTVPGPRQGLALTSLPAFGGRVERGGFSKPLLTSPPAVTRNVGRANCEDDLRVLVDCILKDLQQGGNGNPYMLILEAGWGLTIEKACWELTIKDPNLVEW